MHEVERIADWVGIIDAGRLIWSSPIDDLKSSVRRLHLTGDCPKETLRQIPGILHVERGLGTVAVTVRDYSEDLAGMFGSDGCSVVSVEVLGLEQILVALLGRAEVG